MASEQKGLQPKDAGDGKRTPSAGRLFDATRDASGSGRPGKDVRSILSQKLGEETVFGFSESPTDHSIASPSDRSVRSRRPTDEDLHIVNAAWDQAHSPARDTYQQSIPIRDTTARELEQSGQPDLRKQQKKKVSIDREVEERTFSKDKAISEDKGETTKIEVDPLDRAMSESIRNFTRLHNEIKEFLGGPDRGNILKSLEENLNAITDDYSSKTDSRSKRKIYQDFERIINNTQLTFDKMKELQKRRSLESMAQLQKPHSF
jgi:hypothetical protein